jgi:hypothetical protein
LLKNLIREVWSSVVNIVYTEDSDNATPSVRLCDCEIVDLVPQKGGIINNNDKIGFDQEGRVTNSYHKNDPNNYTQPWTARLGVWQKYQITN